MNSEEKTQSRGRNNSDQEMDEFLSKLDMIDAPAPNKTANAFEDRPALLAKLIAMRDDLKADAYANGWTAQGWRKIDAHRAANPEDHARNRRGQRQQKIFDATGRVPRLNRKNTTPEQRAADLATNSKNYRKRKTPEQKKEDAAKKKALRVKAKQAEQEAMEKLPTFGIA